MGHTAKQCFEQLQRRFKDIDFCIGTALSHEQKSTFIIDQHILEEMATNPKVAQNYEQKITLMLELQKVFAQHGKKESSMMLLD